MVAGKKKKDIQQHKNEDKTQTVMVSYRLLLAAVKYRMSRDALAAQCHRPQVTEQGVGVEEGPPGAAVARLHELINETKSCY